MAINFPAVNQPILFSVSESGILYQGQTGQWNVAPVTEAVYKTYRYKLGPRGASSEVRMDNYKVALNGTGNASLVIGTVSGTRTINYSTQAITSQVFGASAENIVVGTAYVYFVGGWSLTGAGNIQEAIWQDSTSYDMYRATLIIGSGYNINTVTIEKLSN